MKRDSQEASVGGFVRAHTWAVGERTERLPAKAFPRGSQKDGPRQRHRLWDAHIADLVAGLASMLTELDILGQAKYSQFVVVM